MTKINKIILDGFKTFGKRTVLEFSDKLNMIIGPNGSGKSNISDAICFVLGRSSAKSMRADKVADLIYNGGKKGKPRDECEVTVVFDNSKDEFPVDSKEVRLTRIVRRNKTNLYKINDKIRTRQDIINLLSKVNVNPDGYNVVLQDDITNLITMPDINKREIIEEAAGLTSYREKKEKAEFQLEEVEQRIKDSKIILEERSQYVEELKRDKNEALHYKELVDNLDLYKYNIIIKQIKKKNEDLDKIHLKIEETEKNIDLKKQEITKKETQIEKNKLEITQINNIIEEKGEKEQVELNKELESLKIKLAEYNSDESNIKEQLNNLSVKKKNTETSLKQMLTKIDELKKKKKEFDEVYGIEKKNLDKITKQLDEFREKINLNSLDSLNKQVNEIDEKTDQLNQEIQEKREKLQSFIREKDRILMELEDIDKKIKKIDDLKKEHAEEIRKIEELKKEFKTISIKLADLMNEDSKISSQIVLLRKELSALNNRQVVLSIKAQEIKESANRNSALKKIEELRKDDPNIYGTVAELGSVESKYELALSMSAGNRMNFYIVKDDETAAKCINILKENKLGAVSFIPLNKIKSINIRDEEKELLKINGVIDFAINLVDFDSRYKKAFQFVFGNTLIVKDVNTARRVGIGKIRMVSLDGDIIESSGVMFGGYINRKNILGKFQDINTKDELNEVNEKISQLNEKLSNFENRKQEIINEIDDLRNKKSEFEGEIIKREKSLYVQDSDLSASQEKKEELNKRLTEYDEVINKYQKEVNSLLKEITQLKTEKQNIKNKISEVSDPSKLAELRAYEESRDTINQKLRSLENEINNIQTKIEIQEHEIDSSRNILADLEKQERQFNHELEKISINKTEIEKTIKEKNEKFEKFYSEFKSFFKKRSNLEKDNLKLENEIKEIEEAIKKFENEVNNLRIREAKTQTEISNLEEDLKAFKDKEEVDLNETELVKKIKEIEEKLNNIGAVNLRSIEIFEEAEKEFNELKERLDKLKQERESVLDLINEIETKRKMIFKETFNKINGSFQTIFTKLAPKGEAFLELEDPENPFNGGLKLKVRLNKDKFIELRSLSGGEKALTALSFIFALQEYSPSTFYVFDEVDASLDAINSRELGKWIKEYSKRAQYIVISHNDYIISESDKIFGVSMDKDTNLSKVVSLNV